MHRHADADINNLLSNSVPPMDVSKISIFQQHLSKYNSEVRRKEFGSVLLFRRPNLRCEYVGACVLFTSRCPSHNSVCYPDAQHDPGRQCHHQETCRATCYQIISNNTSTYENTCQTFSEGAPQPRAGLRLQQQLLQATWAQTALNFDADLLKMNAWARKYDIFSQQQAHEKNVQVGRVLSSHLSMASMNSGHDGLQVSQRPVCQRYRACECVPQ